MAASGRSVPRKPGPPAGVIFGCNRASEDECLNGLFGMSSGHWGLVKEILPGTPCFLFNFNTKKRRDTSALQQGTEQSLEHLLGALLV
eukprot:jgi/Astpho2/7754/Aster-x0782